MVSIYINLFFLFGLRLASAESFPPGFLFGLATAPAHVEDQLEDTWAEFAKKGGVAAFTDESRPFDRLEFWTKPEIEIDLAVKSGVKLLRLGVDWQRLAPELPGSDACGMPCAAGVQKTEELKRYQEILTLARSRGLKIMLTLFHHSAPKWFAVTGGWKNPETVSHFRAFSEDVFNALNPQVDYWITFNEPTIYGLLTYSLGIWPMGKKEGLASFLSLFFYRGSYSKAMLHMADAHRNVYALFHQRDAKVKVGVAHHLSFLASASGEENRFYRWLGEFWNWSFPDSIAKQSDFFGLNYYGAEFPLHKGLVAQQEYSEAGRAISPFGFYLLLKRAHQRYGLPVFVTENGTADSTDFLRPAYLTEHLAALLQAMKDGVPILGYVFWTVSDNWEWADGYCPKFGLYEVNRKEGLRRTARPSAKLFQAIVESHSLLTSQREEAWRLVRSQVGKSRPMCRNSDGVSSAHRPWQRAVVDRDWRFKLPYK
jgi:galactolipid galactosyltransferase